MTQYAYTLEVGQAFTLPGERRVRTVVGAHRLGVYRSVVDQLGAEHTPETVVEAVSPDGEAA